jgi:hypothetical protein
LGLIDSHQLASTTISNPNTSDDDRIDQMEKELEEKKRRKHMQELEERRRRRGSRRCRRGIDVCWQRRQWRRLGKPSRCRKRKQLGRVP